MVVFVLFIGIVSDLITNIFEQSLLSFNNDCAGMKTSFQAGVDTLYNACVNNGKTPSSSTPTAIAQAINSIRTPYRGQAVTVDKSHVVHAGGYYAINSLPEGFYASEGAGWAPEVRINDDQAKDCVLYNDGRNQGHADSRSDICIQVRKNGNTVTFGWRYASDDWRTIRDPKSFTSASGDVYEAKQYNLRYNNPPIFV